MMPLITLPNLPPQAIHQKMQAKPAELRAQYGRIMVDRFKAENISPFKALLKPFSEPPYIDEPLSSRRHPLLPLNSTPTTSLHVHTCTCTLLMAAFIHPHHFGSHLKLDHIRGFSH